MHQLISKKKLIYLFLFFFLVSINNLTIMNVFHAGDGNLHPLLVFDASEEGTLERVHAVAAEIVKISLEAGGVLSGEHGIGIEKQEFMQLVLFLLILSNLLALLKNFQV